MRQGFPLILHAHAIRQSHRPGRLNSSFEGLPRFFPLSAGDGEAKLRPQATFAGTRSVPALSSRVRKRREARLSRSPGSVTVIPSGWRGGEARDLAGCVAVNSSRRIEGIAQSDSPRRAVHLIESGAARRTPNASRQRRYAPGSGAQRFIATLGTDQCHSRGRRRRSAGERSVSRQPLPLLS
jgi:hypothetical protein